MTDQSKPQEQISKVAKPLDVIALLSLPDQLRKTALSILKLGKTTVTEVVKDTGRERVLEEECLKQLVEMGYVKVEQQGCDVFFFV